jgi:hypothetical protein
MSTMPRIVKWAEDHAYRAKIDAIVACGHSGLVIAGALSYVTRIPVFAARKIGEPTVAWNQHLISAFTPNGPAKNWLWLDDLISTGGTFRNAAKQAWDERLVERPYPALILEYAVRQDDLDSDPNDRSRLHLGAIDEMYDWDNAPQVIPSFGFRE